MPTYDVPLKFLTFKILFSAYLNYKPIEAFVPSVQHYPGLAGSRCSLLAARPGADPLKARQRPAGSARTSVLH